MSITLDRLLALRKRREILAAEALARQRAAAAAARGAEMRAEQSRRSFERLCLQTRKTIHGAMVNTATNGVEMRRIVAQLAEMESIACSMAEAARTSAAKAASLTAEADQGRAGYRARCLALEAVQALHRVELKRVARNALRGEEDEQDDRAPGMKRSAAWTVE